MPLAPDTDFSPIAAREATPRHLTWVACHTVNVCSVKIPQLW